MATGINQNQIQSPRITPLDPYAQANAVRNQSGNPEQFDPDPTTSTYPRTDQFFGAGSTLASSYDLIVIGGNSMPLAGSPDGGTTLEIDRQKGAGRDWETLRSKGYTAVPTRFTLMLFRDMLSGVDWLSIYDQVVRDLLMPRKIDKRNAISIYNPLLSGDGIVQFISEHRGTPKHVGRQIFHVEVQGIDLRFSKDQSAVGKVKPPPGLVSGPLALSQGGKNYQPTPQDVGGGTAGVDYNVADPNQLQSVTPAASFIGQP